MFIADFHIHSKYSRATSKNMDLESLDEQARIKGIKVLGTGDFTHPDWFNNLKEKLEPAESGLFKVKKNDQGTRFILTSEISCIYSKKNRVRKIHIVVFAPSLEAVEKINTQLGWIGNLKSDGRPILGLDAKELVKITLQSCPECFIVPAHIWTPWFSLFGSRSGFDSIQECFEDYSKYIYAVETGLSSDPPMNWKVQDLDNITLISNSDAHSSKKIGREANVFETKLSYPALVRAIKEKNPSEFLYTIEFFPQEGKYHFDGHRVCGVSFSPEESKKNNNICPVCGKPLTLGVLNRVEELAGKTSLVQRAEPKNRIPFKSLIPLEEIIASVLDQGVGTKAVEAEYNNLIRGIGSEFQVLLEAKEDSLKTVTLPEIAEGIVRVRQGRVNLDPGFDGVFGKVHIFSQGEQKDICKQSTLF